EEVVDLGQRIIGRVSCETIADPVEKKKKIVKANQYIDERIAAELQRIGVEQLKIRSVLTCECGRGVCAMCYGRNLATGDFVKLGEAVGIIAAQSIGEPGTYNVPILSDKGGKIEFRDMIAGVTIKREVDEATGLMGTMVIEHKEDLHPQVVIVDDKKEVLASYSIPAVAHVIVEEGQKV